MSHRDPCPICGRHKGCLALEDGAVICLKEPSGEPCAWGLGGWWHRATAERPSAPIQRTPAPSTPPADSADLATRHNVNTRLLALCPLSDEHRAYLRSCGDVDEDMESQFGSLPRKEAQGAIITALVQEFGADVLRTVPGVVEQAGKLRLNGAGLLVAIRDVDGYLVGFQVRYGPSDYRWLSGGGGPSAGAPVHVARPRVRRDHRVYVVESPKSAAMLAQRLGAIVIGLGGQSNWRAARQTLAHLVEYEEAGVLVIALDAAAPDASDTAAQQLEGNKMQLAATAAMMGCGVRIAGWQHSQGKGPDDVVLNGNTWALEIYRPEPIVVEPEVVDTGETWQAGTDEKAAVDKLYSEALAMSHTRLAKAYAQARYRLRVANDYLALVGRIAAHQAVITPQDDPTAKRVRAVLSASDRVVLINDTLQIRAAAQGGIPKQPVPVYRGQTATLSRVSNATVTTARQQGARLGLIQMHARGDDDAQHIALPPVMPSNDITVDVLDIESPRRRTERLRTCRECGSGDLEEVRTRRIVCRDCGTVLVHEEARRQLQDTTTQQPPVANCNAWVPVTVENNVSGEVMASVGGVANCTYPLSERERRAHLDRVARRRGRGHEDEYPTAGPPDPPDWMDTAPLPWDGAAREEEPGGRVSLNL